MFWLTGSKLNVLLGIEDKNSWFYPGHGREKWCKTYRQNWEHYTWFGRQWMTSSETICRVKGLCWTPTQLMWRCKILANPMVCKLHGEKKKKVICMGIKQPIQDSHYSILDGISCSAAVVKRHQPHQHHGINKFINQPVVPWARPRHTWGVWWYRHVSSSTRNL